MYYLTVTLHVFAALFWLGGMFFLGVVGAPVLRKVEPPELRSRLFQDLGRAFRTSGWIAIDTHLHSEMSIDSSITTLPRTQRGAMLCDWRPTIWLIAAGNRRSSTVFPRRRSPVCNRARGYFG